MNTYIYTLYLYVVKSNHIKKRFIILFTIALKISITKKMYTLIDLKDEINIKLVFARPHDNFKII